MNDNDIAIECVPAQQHVPEIECTICTIKVRHCVACHSLPFNSIPIAMIKALAKRVVKFLCMFLPKGGVSQHWSPQTIVTGHPWNIMSIAFVQSEVLFRL